MTIRPMWIAALWLAAVPAARAQMQTAPVTPSTGTAAPAPSTGTVAPPIVSSPTAPASAPRHGGMDAEDRAENKGQWRPGKGLWHQDCDADVQRLCPGLTERQAVIDCLGRNTDKLSPKCRQMRGKTEKRWKQEERRELPKR